MHNRYEVITHLREHQKYPAKKAELVKTCRGLEDFEPEDKEWFKESLTRNKYTSAGEVIEDLGW